jgi:hypothetical protein
LGSSFPFDTDVDVHTHANVHSFDQRIRQTRRPKCSNSHYIHNEHDSITHADADDVDDYYIRISDRYLIAGRE